MSFPDYLSGIINSHSRNKQVEDIKKEMRRMLPQKNSSNNPQNLSVQQPKPVFRKTISHFVSLIPELQGGFEKKRETQGQFYRKEGVEKKKARRGSNKGSQEGQTEQMTEWRVEMMRHIKPKREVVVQPTETEPVRRFKGNKITEEMMSKTGERKIFKIRSTASLKDRVKLTFKPTIPVKTVSHKNFILIRPTFEQANEARAVKERFERSRNVLKINKQISIDKFFQPLEGRGFDEMEVQRITSFQALLPFLGAQKASVEVKPEQKKQKYVKYDLQQLSRLNRHSTKSGKDCPRVAQKITGWQTPDEQI